MAAITFDGVTKRFGETVAVDDLDLDVADGEFLVLVGPSGCGKSTVLRLVAGLETPDQGTVAIGSEVVNDVPAKGRDVAMVFQSYALYPHMSVRANIEFALRPLGLERADRARRVTDAATALGLDAVLDRKPGQLSGGQRQRVALARAIVREPRAFLMDEPLSNLDAALRGETRAELVRLHRKLETTFVYVTHDQTEAMAMADRIAVMVDGRLQQVGTPQEIYDEPANVTVARFIGSPAMNTWPATVAGPEPELAVDGLRLRPPTITSLELGRDVIVGARPEAVRFADRGLPVVVDAVEPLGHEHVVTCHRPDGGRVILRQSSPETPLPGEPAIVALDPSKVLVFDATSEERIA